MLERKDQHLEIWKQQYNTALTQLHYEYFYST